MASPTRSDATQDNIFIIKDDVLVEATSYLPAREAHFQNMITQHPGLLGSAQINPDDPPRWLLIKAEELISDGRNTSRWRIDHLFVDHLGTPTLVEIKRSSDTRIRREVIGQMFEYASNSHRWKVEKLRTQAEETAGGEDELRSALKRLLAGDGDEDDVQDEEITRFWITVQKKLELGQLRLLFVADSIPSELRQIIEFLNAQMHQIEVLGVELAHFRHEDSQTTALVPRIIGQTEQVRTRKQSDASGAGSYHEGLERCDDPTRELFTELSNLKSRYNIREYMGARGVSLTFDESFRLYLFPPRGEGAPDRASSGAYLELCFLKKHFTDDERAELRTMLTGFNEAFTLSGELSVKCFLTSPEAIEAARLGVLHLIETLELTPIS